MGRNDESRPTGWHRDCRHWTEHPLHLDYPRIIYYLTDVDETCHHFTISPEPAGGDEQDMPTQLAQGVTVPAWRQHREEPYSEMSLILNGPLPHPWRAGMAWCDGPRPKEGQRAFFRCTFDLAAVPATFRVFVSADSRYRLAVNGAPVGRGPLKGTLARYHVEEYELAPLLRAGRNVLAADVVWFGVSPPLSEVHSGFAGFLLQGPEGAGVDTPGDWRVRRDTSTTWDHTPYTGNAHLFLGGMERVEGAAFPRNWADPGLDDSAWPAALLAVPLNLPGGDPDADLVWTFASRDIPLLVEEPRRYARTLAEMSPIPHLFGDPLRGWDLPAGVGGEIVLDAGALTTGYPTFHFEGGARRTVEIVYGECVWRRIGNRDDPSPYRWGGGGRLKKGLRDDLTDGVIHGYQDTVTLHGGSFPYEPHHWRTFWFVRLAVGPGETPFRLRDADYRFTTYPQVPRSSFEAPDVPDIARMWEVSWRTLQLCSHETYEDCPGYEQLNYLFDARNEALHSLWVAGETALPRRTIRLFRDTLRPDGMLSSRTPSAVRQTIPVFALWWVQMVQDYWDWAGPADTGFVRSNLFAVDGVLSYFRDHLRADGLVGPLPYWNPIGGEDAPGSGLDDAIGEGGATYVTALFLTALEAACRLHREAGFPEDAGRWAATRARLRRALAGCWSEPRGLFLESPHRPDGPVSQHTQAMAILSGAATPARTARAADAMVNACAAPMTRQQGLPFAQALRQAGRYADAAAQYLAEYREQLGLHLTTWVEGPLGGRSDCHAWSAWLPVELLGSVLGVQASRPGFAAVTLAPEPVFRRARGTVATPAGPVTVEWTASGSRITRLEATAPTGVPVTVHLPGHPDQIFPDGGEIALPR